MTPDPPSTPEPIVSLPVGTATLGFLLVVGAAALLIFLFSRRRQDAPPPVPGVEDVPWLVTLLDGLSQGALIADQNGRPVAWNATAAHLLSERFETSHRHRAQ